MEIKFTSKHVRYMTCVACTGVALGVGAIGLSADAATTSSTSTASVAGVTALTSTASAKEKAAVDKEASTAGVTLLMGNALADDAVATATVGAAGLLSTGAVSYEDVAIVQCSDSVNVRSAADENSELVGKIYNNCGASIIATEGDWCKISSGNVVGYMKRQYLAIGNADLAKSVSRREATVTAAATQVKEAADANSASVGDFPQGTVFSVLDESTAASGWIKVTCENGDGFANASEVSLYTKYNLAETVAEEQARLAQEEAQRQAAAEAAMKQYFTAQKKAEQQAAKSNASKSSSSKSNSSGSSRSYSAPSGGGSGSSVANFASQFIGNPYVYGGTSLTNGADCSGFVMSVYGEFGVSLPHSSYSQQNVGYSVSQDDMQPGDIVCYGSHVGIYGGNGTLIHASNERTGITTSNVNYRTILDVRRIY